MDQPSRPAMADATTPPDQQDDDLPPSYNSVINNQNSEEHERAPLYSSVVPPNNTQLKSEEIETVSAATQNEEDDDVSTYHQVFADKSIRMLFCRKVYLFLMYHTLVMTGLISIFIWISPVKFWVQVLVANRREIWLAPVLSMFLCWVVAAYSKSLRRQRIVNCIYFVILTLAESFLLGFLSSYYDEPGIPVAVLFTAALCLAMAAFKIETFRGIFFAHFAVVPLMGYCICLIPRLPTNHAPNIGGAAVFPYLVINYVAHYLRQTFQKNRYSVLPHEYIFIILNMYSIILSISFLIFYVYIMVWYFVY